MLRAGEALGDSLYEARLFVRGSVKSGRDAGFASQQALQQMGAADDSDDRAILVDAVLLPLGHCGLVLDGCLVPDARRLVEAHRQRGHFVAIVTSATSRTRASGSRGRVRVPRTMVADSCAIGSAR